MFPPPWNKDKRYKMPKAERSKRASTSFTANRPHALIVDDYRRGYPKFAAYINSDPDFRIYRRFGTLRNRVILYKQLELAELEQQLNALDEKDWKEDPLKIQSIRKDREISNDLGASKNGNQPEIESERTGLIRNIDLKLKEYGPISLSKVRHTVPLC